QDPGVGVVPPPATVLPGAAQVLLGGLAEDLPGALDVAGAARAMDEAQRRPDGVVAAEQEAVAGALDDRLHAAAVGLDAGGGGIVEVAAVDGAPEVGVQLEVGAAPVVAH